MVPSTAASDAPVSFHFLLLLTIYAFVPENISSGDFDKNLNAEGCFKAVMRSDSETNSSDTYWATQNVKRLLYVPMYGVSGCG